MDDGSYVQSLHLDEGRLYRCICHLRDSNAAPTAAQSFIESLSFFKGLWGFSTCNVDTLVSARIKGAVYSMLLKKRPLTQARPLRVEEVRALESLVLEPIPVQSWASWQVSFCFVFTTAADSATRRMLRVWSWIVPMT